MAKHSQETKERALDNWLSGLTDEENARILGMSRTETIAEWRKRYGWKVIKKRVESLAEEQYVQKRAEASVIDRLAVDQRHRKTVAMLQMRILNAIQIPEEEEEENRFERLKCYKISTEAIMMLIGMERKLLRLNESTDNTRQTPTEYVFKIQAPDGTVINDMDDLEHKLTNQNPHEYHPTLPADVIESKTAEIKEDIPIIIKPVFIE